MNKLQPGSSAMYIQCCFYPDWRVRALCNPLDGCRRHRKNRPMSIWLTSHVDARETLMSWRAQEFLKLVEIDFYICWEINLKAFWLNLPTTVKIKFFFNFYKVRLRTYVFTSVKCILTTICLIVLENDKTVLTFHCHSVYLFIFTTLLRS